MNPNAPSKPRPTRLIGIDYGMARIGISVSDEKSDDCGAADDFTSRKENRKDD